MKQILISCFAVIFSIFLFQACNNNQRPKPVSKNILNRQQMSDIICDLHIADGILTSGVISESRLLPDTVLYKAVFIKHHTTSKVFQESIIYYTTNDMPSLKLIYADAVEKLNNMKTELMGSPY